MQKFTFSGTKKIFLLLLFVEVFSFTAYSAPGDTTWVTVWNARWLDHYGNYDTTAVFPTGKRYRKIRMHYILGRYNCPGSPQFCGSWDYTTQIFSRPPQKDSVEIARIITPYATDWTTSRTHDYVVEVTDYATALEGTNAMRFDYEGYSWGFTITLKLEFIEGIPPMDALSVKNIYDGFFNYGAATTAINYIENKLVPKPFTYTAPASRVFIKNTVSGHGADQGGCAEFCSKYYKLKLNNTVISQKQLWRSNCGLNNVYPQTGTWIYDRGNWCPGAVVWPIYHDISSLTSANTTFTVDVDMQPFAVATPTGGYNWVSQIINYSVPNHNLDVSIEDVLVPSKDPNYKRINNSCSHPIIMIRNTGSDSLKSVVFDYGIKGQPVTTYTWTGRLGFLDTTLVNLPSLPSILNNTLASVQFNVKAMTANGNQDQNVFNNTYTSTSVPVAIIPADIVVKMLTNNSTEPTTQANETTWTLYDDAGAVVAFRDGSANSMAYNDTIFNLAPGCYKFSIDDSGCDGMSWWANTAGGTGTMKITKLNGVSANTSSTFQGDFGCNYTQYYKVLAPPPSTVDVAVKEEITTQNYIEVYPNPATNVAYIKFDLSKSQTVNYFIYDISGKKVYSKTTNKLDFAYDQIPLSDFNSGVYFISLRLEDGTMITKKMVVQM